MKKLTQSQQKRISRLLNYSDFTPVWRKLSDVYPSRSTRVASIYYSNLFIINENKEDIIKAGYSPLCKAIISVNMANQLVSQFVNECQMHAKIESIGLKVRGRARKINARYKSLLTTCAFRKQVDKFARYIDRCRDKNKGELPYANLADQTTPHLSTKIANQIAWKKQGYITELVGVVDIVTLRSLILKEFRK